MNLLNPSPFFPVLWIGVMLVVYVGVPYALFRFGRRILRALERRPMEESQFAVIRARLLELEERVADLSVDNARLLEQQQFTTALLAARPSSTEHPPAAVAAEYVAEAQPPHGAA